MRTLRLVLTSRAGVQRAHFCDENQRLGAGEAMFRHKIPARGQYSDTTRPSGANFAALKISAQQQFKDAIMNTPRSSSHSWSLASSVSASRCSPRPGASRPAASRPGGFLARRQDGCNATPSPGPGGMHQTGIGGAAPDDVAKRLERDGDRDRHPRQSARCVARFHRRAAGTAKPPFSVPTHRLRQRRPRSRSRLRNVSPTTRSPAARAAKIC